MELTFFIKQRFCLNCDKICFRSYNSKDGLRIYLQKVVSYFKVSRKLMHVKIIETTNTTGIIYNKRRYYINHYITLYSVVNKNLDMDS